MKYYFFEVKAHVMLNKLEKMSLEGYSSEGCAQMVVDTLMETLGLTKTQLALTLKHFVYDGVYATTEERTHGGGSLNLIKFVADILNMKNELTGA